MRDQTPSASMPLYMQIRESLRHQIVGGQMQPHEQIESEHTIAARFNASRVTVRHALKDLEHEGLIFRVHGKGSFVSQRKAILDITHLKGFAESMRMDGHETFSRVLSLETVACPAAVASQLDCAAGTRVVNLKRLRYADRQPVGLDSTYLSGGHFKTLQNADLVSRDLYDVLQNDCREPIAYADMSIESRLADATVAAALNIRKGDAVLQIVRIARRTDGTPIDVEYIDFRGESFRYRLRLNRE